MTNLFSYASKEPTNSGVWAWLLSGFSDTNNSKVLRTLAEKLFATLEIPIPEQIRRLEREHTILGRQRIDIWMEAVNGGKPYIFLVENKISRDENVCRQIVDYVASIKQEGVMVYPAIFSHDPLIKAQVSASVEAQQLRGELRVLDINGMIELFRGMDLGEHVMLSHFQQFLTHKEQKLSTFSRSVQTRGAGKGGSLEQWLKVAESKGITDLLLSYISGAEKLYPSDIAFNLTRVLQCISPRPSQAAKEALYYHCIQSGPVLRKACSSALVTQIWRRYLDDRSLRRLYPNPLKTSKSYKATMSGDSVIS